MTMKGNRHERKKNESLFIALLSFYEDDKMSTLKLFTERASLYLRQISFKGVHHILKQITSQQRVMLS